MAVFGLLQLVHAQKCLRSLLSSETYAKAGSLLFVTSVAVAFMALVLGHASGYISPWTGKLLGNLLHKFTPLSYFLSFLEMWANELFVLAKADFIHCLTQHMPRYIFRLLHRFLSINQQPGLNFSSTFISYFFFFRPAYINALRGSPMPISSLSCTLLSVCTSLRLWCGSFWWLLLQSVWLQLLLYPQHSNNTFRSCEPKLQSLVREGSYKVN